MFYPLVMTQADLLGEGCEGIDGDIIFGGEIWGEWIETVVEVRKKEDLAT
jgi:hypothetical protein